MTVWVSKGLQYPIVYLPFAFNRWVPEPDLILFHDGPTRCLHVGGKDSPDYREVERLGREESAGDDSRLTYVALTRAQAQVVAVTFNITVPANTDGSGRTVHIAGSFPPPYPQWDPASNPATRIDATHWTVTLNMLDGTQIDYKYALGDWNYVEKGASCDELGNRNLVVVSGPGGTQTVNDTVLNWRNVSPCGN